MDDREHKLGHELDGLLCIPFQLELTMTLNVMVGWAQADE